MPCSLIIDWSAMETIENTPTEASLQSTQEAGGITAPLDIIELMDILPHRYPFLLIDRVVEVVRKKRIVAIKNVTINEPFFQGHFPGYPIMPGVLIVEASPRLAARCC